MSHIHDHHSHENRYAGHAQPAHSRQHAEHEPEAPRELPPVDTAPAALPAVGAGLDTVDIIHFNDMHRQLEPCKSNDKGGAARLGTALKRLQAEHPKAVTVNVGDVAYDVGPNEGKNAFKPVPELFREMKVDILELGNHEFQDPSNHYASLQEGLLNQFNGDVLCGNVTVKETGQPMPHTKPYTIRQLAGMNVAFIGVVTRDLATSAHPMVGAGLTVAPLAATLQNLVGKAKAEGANAVVVMAHEGYKDCLTLAREVPGIDLLLAAHDHKATAHSEIVKGPDGHQTAVIEAGSHTEYLGYSRLVVDPQAKRVVSVEGQLIPIDRALPADPAVAAIVAQYEAGAPKG